MKNKWLPFILLMSDAAEGTLASAPGAGLLDDDLSDVDTSFPLLAEGVYDMVIKEVKLEENKAKTGNNVVIKVATTVPAKSVKGEHLNPGMVLTNYISTVEVPGKYDRDAIKRNLATFVQATGLGGAINPMDRFKDKIVRCKVKVRPPEGQYEAANDIRFVPVE